MTSARTRTTAAAASRRATRGPCAWDGHPQPWEEGPAPPPPPPAALWDTDADSSGHRLLWPLPCIGGRPLHASHSPSLEKTQKGPPGRPALSSRLLSRCPGEPPPAESHGGACKRRPGTESRPRGAKRGSDRARAGDQAQDVRNTPGRGSSQEGPAAHGHTRLSFGPAAGARNPVFILLTVTEAIYLFHLERDLAPVASPEGALAFLPPATPGLRVPRLPSPGGLQCVPTWARVSLFRSLGLQFPGGSALSSQR